MSRSVVETVLGAFVLIGALIFLVFSYSEGDAGNVTGYKISANFSGIGGLKVGDDVLVSGVKVGQVSKIELDAEQYLARVTMEIDDNIQLPDDTIALISSQSLLGGKYMALEPGGSPDYLENGSEILYTQAPQNLEELLGKFIFSMQKSDKDDSASMTSENHSSVSAPPVSTPVIQNTAAPEQSPSVTEQPAQ
ncbi:MAG TPA: outer membrane lipid asymmetry maintenance protein MlaD [Alphaproteobacteria bacterium]|nr:outer membrane lipid asymmetry maintenance protein MlaD [Alphaproteobacteria bacterium]HOO50223.1 outer membrane lipid asymmetry maintenance protein MlaD [Alphaproteobacteria bacterium]